ELLRPFRPTPPEGRQYASPGQRPGTDEKKMQSKPRRGAMKFRCRSDSRTQTETTDDPTNRRAISIPLPSRLAQALCLRGIRRLAVGLAAGIGRGSRRQQRTPPLVHPVVDVGRTEPDGYVRPQARSRERRAV